ncbi:MAG: prepilin peptidase [Lachnospiraceae bacterium]|nr:prepilin peptidase [Lachnospiraceae bacterium]
MIFRLLLVVYLLVLSFDDIKHRKVPVFVLWIGLGFVLVWLSAGINVSSPPEELVRRVMTALLGAVPGGLLTFLSFYSDKVGRGDGLVLMILGLTENCMFSMILICAACIGLAVFSGILMCMHRVNGKTRMPYIPFVTGAYILIKLSEGSRILL